jgi:single-stranded DNA-binding protein
MATDKRIVAHKSEVHLAGLLAKEPAIRTTNDGKKVVTLTIASYKRELPKLGRPSRGWEVENE